MTSLAASKRHLTVQINDRTIAVEPRETILQAALRQGIDFPSSCRVGGCGACKCRLDSGRVQELTETGYLLSAEEIEQGYILACQSVPRTDLRIDVEPGRGAEASSTRGRVVAQQKVTHDITALHVQLDSPLTYRGGQFANVRIDGLDGVVRSYSFATPARSDGRVSFLVRKVPGGVFSSLVNDEDLLERVVHVSAPAGDFYLRKGEEPLLLVAGGSGLAPILALLEEALAAGDTRSVTLLFGAREERDLYAIEEIVTIAHAWRGEFRFIPVLSAAPPEATWAGERGLVTDKIPGLLEAGARAYLCGPPAMIDGAVDVLSKEGVANDHIHADRFVTRADTVPVVVSDVDAARPMSAMASVFHYLKFFLFHIVGLFSAAALLAGGHFATAGLLTVLVVYIMGDAVLGDDTSTPAFKRPWILTAQLWLALPLLAFIALAAVWSVAPGDPLGLGHGLTSLFGYDFLGARDATTLGEHVSAWILTGLMIGMVGTIPGHELTHRTWDPVSMLIGRWLLAFSFDTSFAVEHVYGHHRYVSTTEDPATAPRGRNVYFHVVASTLKGNLSALHIEAERLAKRRLPLLSWHNAVFRGYAMSIVLVALAGALGGWMGGGFFVICALWGKALLEIVNYMEHYGMVRNPAVPVQPRHSWNTNRRMSSWSLFNLTRHSHHHAQGEVAYQDLRPYPDAPMMINGYLLTLVIAMIPPLWHKLMTPKVLAWDRDYATGDERGLAAAANARSGIRELREANRHPAYEQAAHAEPVTAGG